ncbi:MAG: hypothetical protein FWC84_04785 [Alphaproteobacteria bacterium]|nr:hypothetical protein [Alphaproteobacteria bacterium]
MTLQINLEKQYGGRHLWTMGYFAIPFGTITGEMINDDIHNEQEGERVAADRELPALQARVIQYVRRLVWLPYRFLTSKSHQ